ncbi:MAG: hypothetical protein LBC85_05895, partial [Fibromonadaceae bacterium]|nr:hypothetical protein [Fibromonadaceae bacterium]
MSKDKIASKNELAPKGRYAKLTLDLTFKKAFASKKYSDLLITLLNTFLKKKLFYLCMAVANSAPKSKGWNFDFPRVYSLNFINFDLDFGEGNDEIVQYLSLSNETNPKIRYTYI